MFFLLLQFRELQSAALRADGGATQLAGAVQFHVVLGGPSRGLLGRVTELIEVAVVGRAYVGPHPVCPAGISLLFARSLLVHALDGAADFAVGVALDLVHWRLQIVVCDFTVIL